MLSAKPAWPLERHHTETSLDEAIFYYKLSLNTRQRMRAGTRGLDQAIRDSFTQTLAGLVLPPTAKDLTLIVTTEQGAVPLLRKVTDAELNDLAWRRCGRSPTLAPRR